MLNAHKLIEEAGEYWHVWRYPPLATHLGGSWVNRWVESARASAYWIGHVDAVVHPAFVFLVVVELVRWLR